jgi:hypothetical protein
MATLDEILSDPNIDDEQKISINGQTVTLKDLRAGFMKDADYRKKTTEVATQRREVERLRTEFEEARLQAEAQLQAMAEKIVRKEPEIKQDELMTEIEANPIAKKLMTEIKSLGNQIGELSKFREEATGRLAAQEQTWMAAQHRSVLNKLMAEDPEMVPDEVIKFAQQNSIPRLDHAYKLLTEEKRISSAVKKAADEAKLQGIEEGKRSVQMQGLPQRRLAVVDKAVETPKSFDEAYDRAREDPEIIGLLNDLGGGLR